MSDNKNLTGSPDNKRIDIHDPNEVRNWTKSFGCTAEELKKAVNTVGTSATAVKKQLSK
ncbi:DUF3606 domain-containing protein [Geobacter sp. SVR]|uniref:DUF3606 domain-containing protein n=1 Tax=Geobacter sp. SVR TaxID=2495594 RepID=UPI00143EFB74|nr:DUF3606 domain-containing protein [Geobacter sp. SVR]BCS51763.1 hypothetical protein GSVR_00710 [Geobacter sp. SVR]GCF84950.1 DUF3606 domain-containing protein [Geobacter sp. SVR]